METFILLAILNFNNLNNKSLREQDKYSDLAYKKLEEQLMDWSEGIGLIRSLSHHTTHHSLENSMDIDFNPSADHSLSSISTTFKHNEFEIYLLEKFKNFNRIKEIVEIVSERCGILLDSDEEDEKESLNITNSNRHNNEISDSFISKHELKFKSKSKDQPKHVNINFYEYTHIKF